MENNTHTEATAKALVAINGLSLEDAKNALALCEVLKGGLKPEHEPGMNARIAALKDRIRRLTWTAERERLTRRAR